MPKLIVSEEKLSVYDFGRKLLETEDLDPVYVVLQTAIEQELITPRELHRWLIAYWCFYHCGTASWASSVREKDEGAFWTRMREAAGTKDYPRSAERRHFRGDNAVESVAFLANKGVQKLYAPLFKVNYVYPLSEVLDYVKTWVGFGPWIAFKVADMLERLDLVKINFPIEGIYDSPRDGAIRMWGATTPLEAPKFVVKWAINTVLNKIPPRLAPPRYERYINVQEVETILCKWNSYMKGKYKIGEDIEHLKKGLEWASYVPLSKNLLQAGKVAKLW